MTTEALRHLPDCPTCGQSWWVLVMCTCEHPAASHDINDAGARTYCLSVGESGIRCHCKRFKEVS